MSHPHFSFCGCKPAATWIAQLHITGKLAFNLNLDQFFWVCTDWSKSQLAHFASTKHSVMLITDRTAFLNTLTVLSKRVLKPAKGDKRITWLHVRLHHLIQVSAQSLFTRLQLLIYHHNAHTKRLFILLEWPFCLCLQSYITGNLQAIKFMSRHCVMMRSSVF